MKRPIVIAMDLTNNNLRFHEEMHRSPHLIVTATMGASCIKAIEEFPTNEAFP